MCIYLWQKFQQKNTKNIAKTYKIRYTKIIEERENKRRNFMEGTNAKSLEKLERERESLNIEDIGFISHSIKLYIKYKELKIKLTNGIGTSDIWFGIR